MANAHRRFLDQPGLEAVLRASGVEAPLTGQEVLSGGTFNTVYRLSFADHPSLVMKLTPDPRGAAMAYEQGILQTEGDFYRLAAERAGLPVPTVIAVPELGAEVGGGQALLVSELRGAPWSESAVPDADRAGLRVRQVLADCSADLDGVLVPALVHFDLWDGNVLVDLAAEDGPRITGIIDGERAMWGDPVVDLVSTALFGEIRDDESFIRGYQRSGAIVPLDDGARRRLLLYRVYLGLIMTVEPIPRGEPRSTEFAELIAARLSADVTELEHLTQP